MPSRAFVFFRSLVFFVAGTFLLLGTLLYVPFNALWIAHSEVAPSLVIATPSGPFHPRVRFVTGAGDDFVTGLHGAVWGELGDELAVRYDPMDPHTAVVDTFLGRWGSALFVGGMGIVFVVLAFVAIDEAGGPIRHNRRRSA